MRVQEYFLIVTLFCQSTQSAANFHVVVVVVCFFQNSRWFEDQTDLLYIQISYIAFLCGWKLFSQLRDK
jgi:hypothetical protein